MSCGFWPGSDQYPHTIFYSYAYPTPDGFSQADIKPDSAFFNKDLGEFVLHYDEVQNAEDPEAVLMSFLHSSFEAASKLGNWDRQKLSDSPFRISLSEKYQHQLQ